MSINVLGVLVIRFANLDRVSEYIGSPISPSIIFSYESAVSSYSFLTFSIDGGESYAEPGQLMVLDDQVGMRLGLRLRRDQGQPQT